MLHWKLQFGSVALPPCCPSQLSVLGPALDLSRDYIHHIKGPAHTIS